MYMHHEAGDISCLSKMGRLRLGPKWKADSKIGGGVGNARARPPGLTTAGVGAWTSPRARTASPRIQGWEIGKWKEKWDGTYSAEAYTPTSHSIGASERNSEVLSMHGRPVRQWGVADTGYGIGAEPGGRGVETLDSMRREGEIGGVATAVAAASAPWAGTARWGIRTVCPGNQAWRCCHRLNLCLPKTCLADLPARALCSPPPLR